MTKATKAKTVKTGSGVYLVRGNWSVADLRSQYDSFVSKYGDTLTFDQWLVQRGKVYVKLR